MEKKINVAELLKDCPKGMELDCVMYDNLFLDKVEQDCRYPIGCYTIYDGCRTSVNFTEFGEFNSYGTAKCVIFPKGKTTWKDFKLPYKFKDGDIVTGKNYACSYIAIYRKFIDNTSFSHHVCLTNLGRFKVDDISDNTNLRFATKEEEQKLFNAITVNGYKWNANTKALEKLPKPIEDKGNISDGYHTFNELYEYRLLYNASMFNELAKQGLYDVHKSKKHSDGTIPFGDENWFIVQAELPTGQISNHYEMKDWELFDIPEKEKANHYDGHTPQDVAKRLKDFLSLNKLNEPKYKVGDRIRHKYAKYRTERTIISYGKRGYWTSINGWIAYESQDDYELIPYKFDISTLKPYDKVLVRLTKDGVWKATFFSHYDKQVKWGCYRFVTTSSKSYSMCIPYKNNEHLLGTSNDCDDYYKTWK